MPAMLYVLGLALVYSALGTVAALSGGGRLYPVAESVVAKAAGQVAQVAGMDEINALVWAALKRKLDREGCEYAV